MRILCNGTRPDGAALVAPRIENELAGELKHALLSHDVSIAQHAEQTYRCTQFGEQHAAPANPLDPVSAGWTYVINPSSPNAEANKRAIAPLARHRAMAAPERPLLMDPNVDPDGIEWLEREYHGLALAGEQVPAYVLLVGTPTEIPFAFQALMATVANVGRVDFDHPDALAAYIDKLLRVETGDAPVASRLAAFFGTDSGPTDATHFSRRYMVEPLHEHVSGTLRIHSVSPTADHATRSNLVDLAMRSPALMFSASHGLGAIDEVDAAQRHKNGALICHDGPFGHGDVPADGSFVHGGIFFQFACFGYGTPACSDFARWSNSVPARYASEAFVASLPKTLLAHRNGPVAYVGHVDLAWIHGFTDPDSPHATGRWHERIAPFKSAVERILEACPVGHAMRRMNEKLNAYNQALNATRDRVARRRLDWDDDNTRRYLDRWIGRGDAQNYMILGDPGARVRFPAE